MRPDDGGGLANEWTQANDPRVTPFGRFLRSTHLDELPQVVNIVRGDLSLVGPRPEQPRYVSELSDKLPFYDLRHLVRPGLTGWAQVKYGYAGDENDALEKLQYEFFYLRHQSLGVRLAGSCCARSATWSAARAGAGDRCPAARCRSSSRCSTRPTPHRGLPPGHPRPGLAGRAARGGRRRRQHRRNDTVAGRRAGSSPPVGRSRPVPWWSPTRVAVGAATSTVGLAVATGEVVCRVDARSVIRRPTSAPLRRRSWPTRPRSPWSGGSQVSGRPGHRPRAVGHRSERWSNRLSMGMARATAEGQDRAGPPATGVPGRVPPG